MKYQRVRKVCRFFNAFDFSAFDRCAGITIGGMDDSEGSTTFTFKFLPLYPGDTYIKFRLVADDGRGQEISYHLMVKGLKDVKVWKVRPIRK